MFLFIFRDFEMGFLIREISDISSFSRQTIQNWFCLSYVLSV